MNVRSKEQLAVMLKLIEVNNVSVTRKNLSVRQKIWTAIASKLNQMQGSEKDADGWKRSYYTWRINTGADYQREVAKIINDVPDDDYFYINVTEDEAESDADIEEQLYSKNPTEVQKARLNELVSKHSTILKSTADDEPLKERIWLNITEELNKIPGALKLTPTEWKKRVDLDKYKVKRGRKPTKSVAETSKSAKLKKPKKEIESSSQYNIKHIEFEVLTEETVDSQVPYDHDYSNIDELILEEPEVQVATSSVTKRRSSSFENEEELDIDTLLDDDENVEAPDNSIFENDEDSSDMEYKPNAKRIRATPLVKSFKFSNRIVHTVEKLSNDVQDMKELLKQTTNTLASMQQVVERQCEQQAETNALLRRNTQLLKVLVEYKYGRRVKSKA